MPTETEKELARMIMGCCLDFNTGKIDRANFVDNIQAYARWFTDGTIDKLKAEGWGIRAKGET